MFSSDRLSSVSSTTRRLGCVCSIPSVLIPALHALQDFQRPLFTLGREPLAHLQQIPLHQHWTVRCLQSQPATERAEIIGARGPFALSEERALFARLNTDVLISKNSGSQSTEPKLQVARELGLPVLLLRRPLLPAVDREFVSLDALTEALWATA